MVEHGGFLYDSDTYNDELPYWVRVGERPHLIVPYSLTTNDSKFGRGVFGSGEDFFAFLRDSFDLLYEEGADRPRMMSIGLHMRPSRPGKSADPLYRIHARAPGGLGVPAGGHRPPLDCSLPPAGVSPVTKTKSRFEYRPGVAGPGQIGNVVK